ncbi:hypothetical protein [Virgibacillus dokdonensis]|uniref:Uncharacterized protein n=1 Tax=Virgibacillus dokdonensis TaxID=302167 RepID=A0A2K9ITK6_9BACI|nr:hypothetical protein [Virgibacillus dokdonensis]AUJ23129.1 hypothetical protein A21D_00013 [Virgibacillus dokdonensis]
MESNNWRNRDWIWLVGILMTIIILLIASFFSSTKLQMNFSIISSAVSIALALVAIFLSLKQDSDNQRLNGRLLDSLSSIQGDVKSVDAKLDPKELNNVSEETAEEFNQEIQDTEKETYTKEEVEKIINDVSKNVATNINKRIDFQNDKNNLMELELKKERERSAKLIKNNKILYIIRDNLDKDVIELRKIIRQKTGSNIPIEIIKRMKDKIEQEQFNKHLDS